jgi:uncharacterized protein
MPVKVPGMPTLAELDRYRIWDSYFTPSFGSPGTDGGRLIADIERTLPTFEKARFQRACLFPHVGVGTSDARTEAMIRANPELVMKPFERWPKLLIGMIQLNAANPEASKDALKRWLRDGPMLGVYLPAGPREEQCCTHPNVRRLIDQIVSYGGAIMQHTWFITAGKRYPGMSTPSELAAVARLHPDAKFICAHAGGEWEQGIRAVRPHRNVWIETSGFDATAGFIEMAVRELGAPRIIFGSHLPSRSLGTELGKVVAADISERAKEMILGENYRKMLAPVMRKKGML